MSKANQGVAMFADWTSAGTRCAISEARRSLEEGGIPIGAALMDDEGHVIGAGRNRRVQKNNPILHAEIDCLANAARRPDYSDTVLFSTLMPCYMCGGAIVQFGIPHVVVGESRNFSGAGDLLRDHAVDVIDLDDLECRELLHDFIVHSPDVWHEDIGTERL
jgi:cytosine deaminase